MTSAVGEVADAGATHASSPIEPPAKRRRGGRRTSNPNISAEERKRLRVLKNRESAMRSLAKKAAYSAKLEDNEKEAVLEYKESRKNLERLINLAMTMRTALGKVPEDLEDLVTDVEAIINKSTTALAEDEDVSNAQAQPQEQHFIIAPQPNHTDIAPQPQLQSDVEPQSEQPSDPQSEVVEMTLQQPHEVDEALQPEDTVCGENENGGTDPL